MLILSTGVLQATVMTSEQAIGIAPIACVPPVLHTCVNRSAAGGTHHPLLCRGGEFNELAPQMPEGLGAPCPCMVRQRQCARSPPSLKRLTRQGLPRSEQPIFALLSAPEVDNEVRCQTDNAHSIPTVLQCPSHGPWMTAWSKFLSSVMKRKPRL
jgi:hypothetical protein